MGTLYKKVGASSLLRVGSALAGHTDCCCDATGCESRTGQKLQKLLLTIAGTVSDGSGLLDCGGNCSLFDGVYDLTLGALQTICAVPPGPGLPYSCDGSTSVSITQCCSGIVPFSTTGLFNIHVRLCSCQPSSLGGPPHTTCVAGCGTTQICLGTPANVYWTSTLIYGCNGLGYTSPTTGQQWVYESAAIAWNAGTGKYPILGTHTLNYYGATGPTSLTKPCVFPASLSLQVL